jgi:hypothetical protein
MKGAIFLALYQSTANKIWAACHLQLALLTKITPSGTTIMAKALKMLSSTSDFALP